MSNYDVKYDSEGNEIPTPRCIRKVSDANRVTVANIQSWRPGVTGFIQYFRTGRMRRVRGVVVAQYDHNNNTYRIGWSMCNPNDVSDSARGLAVAFGRLNVNRWVPASMGRDPSYTAYVPFNMHDLVFVRLMSMHEHSTSPAARESNVPANV